jgi:hypothetical protein
MKRGPERRRSRRDLDGHRVWGIFHKLWGRDVGTPGYSKRDWADVQLALEQLLLDRRKKQS